MYGFTISNVILGKKFAISRFFGFCIVRLFQTKQQLKKYSNERSKSHNTICNSRLKGTSLETQMKVIKGIEDIYRKAGWVNVFCIVDGEGYQGAPILKLNLEMPDEN